MINNIIILLLFTLIKEISELEILKYFIFYMKIY